MSISRTRGWVAAGLAAVLVLAGCDRGPERSRAELEVLKAVGEQFTRRRRCS